MNFKIGDKVLLTTNNWFTGPDGKDYKAVFGTVKNILTAEETLGVKTNSKSTNWYVEIGNMLVAGCQIFYAIKTDKCNFDVSENWVTFEGKMYVNDNRPSLIYNADE